MIDKGTTLFPTCITCDRMYYHDEPYAYWLGGDVCEWVLYKEYDSYVSTCHPNDCLSAVNRKELLEHFRTFSWFEDEDRERLCRTFRQRGIDDTEYDFEDFADNLSRQEILDTLKKGANFTFDGKEYHWGAINNFPECKKDGSMTQSYYNSVHYPAKAKILESLPWNVVEKPREPERYEYPAEDGDYITMLDCDEHCVLMNTFRDGHWVVYNKTHVKWWLKLPDE